MSGLELLYAHLLDRGYQREIFEGELQPAGRGHITTCPFHDDPGPTLLVHGDRPQYFCFACSARGDWIDYLIETRGLSYQAALDRLKAAAGLPAIECSLQQWRGELERSLVLEVAQQFCSARLWSGADPEVMDYLLRRGYTHAEIEGMQLGAWPGFVQTRAYLVDQGLTTEAIGRSLPFNRDLDSRRLVLPYHDACGRLMGLVGRNLTDQGSAVYLPVCTPVDSPLLMYRARKSGVLVLIEGYLDALLASQVGIQGVIGVGRDGLSPEQLELIARLGAQNLILVETAANQARLAQWQDKIRARNLATTTISVPPPHDDVDDYLRHECPSHLGKLVQEAGGRVTMTMCDGC